MRPLKLTLLLNKRFLLDLFYIVDVNDRTTKNMTVDEFHDQLGTLTISGQDTTVRLPFYANSAWM